MGAELWGAQDGWIFLDFVGVVPWLGKSSNMPVCGSFGGGMHAPLGRTACRIFRPVSFESFELSYLFEPIFSVSLFLLLPTLPAAWTAVLVARGNSRYKVPDRIYLQYCCTVLNEGLQCNIYSATFTFKKKKRYSNAWGTVIPQTCTIRT